MDLPRSRSPMPISTSRSPTPNSIRTILLGRPLLPLPLARSRARPTMSPWRRTLVRSRLASRPTTSRAHSSITSLARLRIGPGAAGRGLAAANGAARSSGRTLRPSAREASMAATGTTEDVAVAAVALGDGDTITEAVPGDTGAAAPLLRPRRQRPLRDSRRLVAARLPVMASFGVLS